MNKQKSITEIPYSEPWVKIKQHVLLTLLPLSYTYTGCTYITILIWGYPYFLYFDSYHRTFSNNKDETPFRWSNTRKYTSTSNGVHWSRLERVGYKTSWNIDSVSIKLSTKSLSTDIFFCSALCGYTLQLLFRPRKLCLLSYALPLNYCWIKYINSTENFLLLRPALWLLSLTQCFVSWVPRGQR